MDKAWHAQEGNVAGTAEKQLCSAADKLRKNLDAKDYKYIVFGLISLKYISDSFGSLRARLLEGKGEFVGADPDDRDEYKAKNVFFMLQPVRWNWLCDNAKELEIVVLVDDAMDTIERDNLAPRGFLSNVYGRLWGATPRIFLPGGPSTLNHGRNH